jgi:hypothetical protein
LDETIEAYGRWPATSLDKIGMIAAIKDLDRNTVGLHEPQRT